MIDGKLQSAETDEFIYHECLVHPPLLHHPRYLIFNSIFEFLKLNCKDLFLYVIINGINGLHGPIRVVSGPWSILMIWIIDILDLIENIRHVKIHDDQISFVLLWNILCSRKMELYPVLKYFINPFLEIMSFKNIKRCSINLNFDVPNVLGEV